MISIEFMRAYAECINPALGGHGHETPPESFHQKIEARRLHGLNLQAATYVHDVGGSVPDVSYLCPWSDSITILVALTRIHQFKLFTPEHCPNFLIVRSWCCNFKHKIVMNSGVYGSGYNRHRMLKQDLAKMIIENLHASIVPFSIRFMFQCNIFI